MRKAKQAQQLKKNKKVVRLSTQEKLDRRRHKRKNGPAAMRRREARTDLQSKTA